MTRVAILGGEIDNLSRLTVQQKIRDILLAKTPSKIFTPNPEMLVYAHDHAAFLRILNAGNLNVCDGFGIRFVSLFSKKIPRVERYPGVDCLIDMCKIAEETGKRVFLLGGASDVVLEKTKKELHKKFPALIISGSHPGVYITCLPSGDSLFAVSDDANEKIIDDIIDAAPDILFVAFGHGKQEWWIDRYMAELPSVTIAMGVGGSFDFISGHVRRAPRILRSFGLEWLWRLLLQPWRVKRIWNATARFLYLFFIKY